MWFRVSADRFTAERFAKAGISIVERDYQHVDERTTDDPAKIPAYAGNPQEWYDVGTNHRVYNGHLRRDRGTRRGHFIEIRDLEHLIKLRDTLDHELVIGEPWDMVDTPTIGCL